MTDQKPPNCSTCPHHDRFEPKVKCMAPYRGGHICCLDAKQKPSLVGARQITDSEYEGTKHRGCLSHPDARAWLMRGEDTVTMPRWVFNMMVKKDTPTGYEASKTADEIITLIKNGVNGK